MAYFQNISELETFIKLNILADIIEVDNVLSGETLSTYPILQDVEGKALAIMQSYLHNYDFTALQAIKDQFFTTHLINIFLYLLVCRVNYSKVSDNVLINYKETMSMMKDISLGKFTPTNWITNTSKAYTSVLWHSEQKINTIY